MCLSEIFIDMFFVLIFEFLIVFCRIFLFVREMIIVVVILLVFLIVVWLIFFLKCVEDLLCKLNCFVVWWIEIGLNKVDFSVIVVVLFVIFEFNLFMILVKVIGFLLLVMIRLLVVNFWDFLFNVINVLFFFVWWIRILFDFNLL